VPNGGRHRLPEEIEHRNFGDRKQSKGPRKGIFSLGNEGKVTKGKLTKRLEANPIDGW
jgi:hypothetical protein